MAFAIKIQDNAAAILADVKAFPEAMAKAIAQVMDYQNELTVGHIQEAKLSKRGPNTLGVITNRLRISLNRDRAVITGNTIDSAIGSNVVYAGVHEFGFDGDVQVRGFSRKYKGRDLHTTTKRGTKKLVASGIAHVGPFKRHMKMPARAPFRTGIQERAGDYSKAISEAIVAAWTGGSQP